MAGSGDRGQPGCTLGSLPHDCVLEILQAMVPPLWQDVTVPRAHPDLRPCSWPRGGSYMEMFQRHASGADAKSGEREEAEAAPELPGCMVQ